MKLLKLSALISASLLVNFNIHAAELKSADEVIAKHNEARNLEKIKTIKSMRSVANTQISGVSAPMTIEVKLPNQARIDITVQGMTLTQAIEGSEGWKINPMLGKTSAQALTEDERRLLVESTEIAGSLGDYRAKGHRVMLQETTDVEGAPAYKLQLTKKNGDVEYHYIDTENFMAVRMDRKTSMNGMKVDASAILGDFKSVQGVLLPHAMTQTMKLPMGEVKQVVTISKIEFDVPIDGSRFKKPETEK